MTTPNPTPEDLAGLAARVEALTGPDREVDELILLATGWTLERASGLGERATWIQPGGMRTSHRQGDGWFQPTASIDAAMTLFPRGPGRWPQIEYIGPNPNNIQQGHRVAVWMKTGKPVKGHSPIGFALALTAAALRTLLMEKSDV